MSSKSHLPLIGAYWAPRREGKEQCAKRIAKLLSLLEEDPLLKVWYRKGRTRKKAQRPFSVSLASISDNLDDYRTEDSGRPIDELGFHLELWNGNDASPASLAITCGGCSAYIRNHAVLRLPELKDQITEREIERFRMLLNCLVDAMQPDNAIATSVERLSEAQGKMPWEVEGWVLYRNRSAARKYTP